MWMPLTLLGGMARRSQRSRRATESQSLLRWGRQGAGLPWQVILHLPPRPLLTHAARPLQAEALLRLLTCFGCICKFRSTNGAMNRYIPIGKAQLKFFHRPLSSLVQRGSTERKKQKNRNKNKGRREKKRGDREGEREGMRGKRGTREQRRRGRGVQRRRRGKIKKNKVCQMSSTVKLLRTMRIYGLVD